MMTGDLDASHQRHLDSAEAEKKAGSPAVNVIVSELEALRIDIMRGQVAQALPQVEARLAAGGGLVAAAPLRPERARGSRS